MRPQPPRCMVSIMQRPHKTMPSARPSRRLRRESRTLALMIAMYCRDCHEGEGLCPECADLLEYSLRRLNACPFGARKPTCARCTVHCYRYDMRERVRSAMRYAGPRMTWRHPYLALAHLLDRGHQPRPGGPDGSGGPAPGT